MLLSIPALLAIAGAVVTAFGLIVLNNCLEAAQR